MVFLTWLVNTVPSPEEEIKRHREKNSVFKLCRFKVKPLVGLTSASGIDYKVRDLVRKGHMSSLCDTKNLFQGESDKW
jgi:hypothetical protein